MKQSSRKKKLASNIKQNLNTVLEDQQSTTLHNPMHMHQRANLNQQQTNTTFTIRDSKYLQQAKKEKRS